MNKEVERILYHRAKISQNLEKIIGQYKKTKSDTNQLSLWGESEETEVEVQLDEPENFNPVEVAKREIELIGFSLLYSPFDEYELVRCRYCDSTIQDIFKENKEFGNKTMLARIVDIEYKTSQFGNKYAKLLFSDDAGEYRLYLFGDLYKEKLPQCFKDRIYLLTVSLRKDSDKVDIVNFMPADEIHVVAPSTVWVSLTSNQLPNLRMYTKVFMMGEDQMVNIHISDLNITITDIGKCKVDNENLVEMRKLGMEVKLR